MSSGSSPKAVIVALGANLGIAVSKLVAFAVTGSASLLAESVHSSADAANQLLLIVGRRRSHRAPDPMHPFGHGAERYFYSFIVSLLLFSGGALFAIYEGISKIAHPHGLHSVPVAIVVLTVAVILEGASLRTAVIESRPSKGATSWLMFVRAAKVPELPVVLLEDSAAMAGLLVALAAVILSEVTGAPVWDGIGTVVIGAILAIVAVVLGIEMKSLLIGEAAIPTEVDAIAAALRGAPKVTALIHLRTLHLGPDQVLVGAKLEFDRTLTVAELAVAIDRAEAAVRAAVPTVTTMYIEPDLARPETGDPIG